MTEKFKLFIDRASFDVAPVVYKEERNAIYEPYSYVVFPQTWEPEVRAVDAASVAVDASRWLPGVDTAFVRRILRGAGIDGV